MNLRTSTKKLYYLILILPFTILASGFSASPIVQTDDNDQIRLEQFDLVTDTSGWVLLDEYLFWTSDAGQTWSEISPSIPTGASVEDVEFIDANTGWILSSTINPDGSALFQLTQTTDGGITWAMRVLSLFESGEAASFMERAEMGWFDAQTGWISVKQVSGSNFSIGTLFTTSDGGDSWSRSNLPVADRIVFSDPQTGWAVGGATGDQVFKTQDAGITWQNARPEGIPSDVQSTTYTPVFSNGQGLLVMTNLGLENSLSVYRLETSSGNWSPFDQIALDVQPGIIGLSILDPQNFVATIPGTTSIVRMADGELDMLVNADGLSVSIVELDMDSLDIGWAKSVDSKCATASSPTDQPASVTCSSTTRLLQTTDGGITWQSIPLPDIRSGVPSPSFSSADDVTTMSTISSVDATNVFIGQGFDKCEIPTLSQMQTWWNSSPYKTVNLYIGGSSRACSNNALTSSYLEQLSQQGWQFIPTWVGPQAPCTGYISRMSSDVTTAYDQGVNEANLAVERLVGLGLTYPDKTGSVVYYDIEYYGTNTACREAVNSFMNGWVSQIRARGNLAGVYGSTLCNTGLSDFLTIANVPDVIWPARWYHNMGEGFYDPTATVWNLGTCIPNTVWADHQRIRQYEGDHNETWGGLTLGIDSNVLDGVVATSYVAPLVQSIIRVDSNPTSAATIGFTVNFSESVNGVDSDDFMLGTTGVTGAVITDVSGSGDTYIVTVNTGSDNGTIRLDLLDNDTIMNDSGDRLGGTGLGNGDFTIGEVYDVIKSTTFKSQGARDGWILESSETSNQGGTMNATATLLYIGDNAQDKQYRSFLSFNTRSLPDNAFITKVQLRINVRGFAGGNMFTSGKTHGNLMMDIRNPYFGANADLVTTDFRSAVSLNAVGVLTSAPSSGWYTITLNSTAFPHVNLMGITQFRLRFQKDDNDDLSNDYLKIYSGNAGAARRPQLIVEYYVQ